MSLQDASMMKQLIMANITYKIWTACPHVKFNCNIRKTYLHYTKEKINYRDQWQANCWDQYVDIYPLYFYVQFLIFNFILEPGPKENFWEILKEHHSSYTIIYLHLHNQKLQFIFILLSLFRDKSIASSNASSPWSAIQCFFQFQVSFLFCKVTQ